MGSRLRANWFLCFSIILATKDWWTALGWRVSLWQPCPSQRHPSSSPHSKASCSHGCAACHCAPHGGLLFHSKYTLTSQPSAHSWRLKNFFAPSVLMYIMTKPWRSSSPVFFPLMPGTLRALQGSRDAPDERLMSWIHHTS